MSLSSGAGGDVAGHAVHWHDLRLPRRQDISQFKLKEPNFGVEISPG